MEKIWEWRYWTELSHMLFLQSRDNIDTMSKKKKKQLFFKLKTSLYIVS